MKLLIVAATWNEIKPLEDYLVKMDHQKRFHEHAIEILITGVGGVATAFHLGKMLLIENWDLILQLGICGSFNREIKIGSTVNIDRDCFADLGAEDDSGFLDVFELKLVEKNSFPFKDGWLVNNTRLGNQTLSSLPVASGVSVNKVSGNETSIQNIFSKYRADVESMEGAAFMFCCLRESVPFFQVRCISNYIEKRNRDEWNIPLAIKNLNDTAINFIEELLQSDQQPGDQKE